MATSLTSNIKRLTDEKIAEAAAKADEKKAEKADENVEEADGARDAEQASTIKNIANVDENKETTKFDNQEDSATTTIEPLSVLFF